MNHNSHSMDLHRNAEGFSIIEVMIAMVLLAVALFGLASLQSRGIRGNDLGNRTTQAVALAQDKVEELIHANATGQTITAGSDDNIDETGGAGGIFNRNWAVQSNTPVNNADTIAVTVIWNDVAGQHRVGVNGILSSDGY